MLVFSFVLDELLELTVVPPNPRIPDALPCVFLVLAFLAFDFALASRHVVGRCRMGIAMYGAVIAVWKACNDVRYVVAARRSI